MARIAHCSATRRRAKQDGALAPAAMLQQVLWHVHGLADKWIPLFTQPRIAFGLDLAKHFVSSALLSGDGLHPALRVKRVLMHFGGTETTVERTQSFPEGGTVSSSQPRGTSRRPGRLPVAGGSSHGWQEGGCACPGVRPPESGAKRSSAMCWKGTLPLWDGSRQNAERVENSAFCMEMGAATAASAACRSCLLRKRVKYSPVLPLSFLLTLI